MKKILLFQMNGIAYDSTCFFSSCLGKALENAGIEVTWFDFRRQTMKDLVALCGQSFDAVIDYNSKLPGAVLDDGTPFLNHIQAPFYNYILDHPVYHHANLSVLLENYHVICIDDDHNKYISKWYPHIKSVHTLSVGAAKAENAVKSEQHRKEGILFPATYLNPRDYYELITALPDSMQKYTKAVLDCLLSDTHCTFEAAAMQVYKEYDTGMTFPVFAQSNFLADVYVRALYRERVLEAAAKSGLPVRIFGEKYQESSIGEFSNVTVLPQMSYRDSLSAIAESAFVLNVMPWFKSGIHDRVLNAMYNGAVSITDSSSMMDTCFTPQQDYIAYSLDRIEALPDLLNTYVPDEDFRAQTAARAFAKVQTFTFAKQAEYIRTIL